VLRLAIEVEHDVDVLRVSDLVAQVADDTRAVEVGPCGAYLFEVLWANRLQAEPLDELA
jgi:hypothetical protein